MMKGTGTIGTNRPNKKKRCGKSKPHRDGQRKFFFDGTIKIVPLEGVGRNGAADKSKTILEKPPAGAKE
jgi:hypothetical protein